MDGSIELLNWQVGWILLLAGFVSGAIMGLGFHKEAFLGGYNSFSRRLLRLGHIACCALGFFNLLVSIFPIHGDGGLGALLISYGVALGGIFMPTICFLTAWKMPFRHLFFIPVLSLLTAVLAALFNFGGFS